MIRTTRDQLRNRSPDTIFDTIPSQTFKVVKTILLPPVNVTEAFEFTVNPIKERNLNNLRESRAITAKRYALLPKLISGEMRLNTLTEESEMIRPSQ